MTIQPFSHQNQKKEIQNYIWQSYRKLSPTSAICMLTLF